ncbi:APH-domain-containing protein [Mollisia scopiformis]|uniref:APH-domain-containing protein n=1 Tax=Mollisia scopiformis TaxID=149040 RepID=A0A194XEQ4_MOLSC|nr:APH-domain-containing protein [Mollisia scopiformis]KUJ18237.1 APH-domain-containing protein [Mollisia scopiformis]
MRLANPDAEGMNSKNRIENEVALASTALSAFEPHVVPSVYGWGSAAGESSQGWILQELMPGTPVDEAFGTMSFPQKKQIFAQMAKLLNTLQAYQLPESITGFGASFKGRLEVALKNADGNPYIQGWRTNGVMGRLDAFVERGIPAQFESLTSKQDKVIVHADFTTNNLLFDAKSGRITALIDYDFACVSHPSYEFLRSFDGAGGQFRGWSGDEASDQTALRDAKLHGFPSPLSQATQDGVEWDVAKAWEDELEKLDTKRPKTIEGIDKVADVDAILRTILPWRITNSDIVRLQQEEVIMQCRNDNEAQLIRILNRLGF